jgi:purine-binding chemotaxis protein CheW
MKFTDNTNPYQHENLSMFAIQKSLDGDVKSADFVEKEQYIGLKVDGSEFLMKIAVVNEIIMPPHITYVPNGPKKIDGVINIRGLIVPVVNLRKIMGRKKGIRSSASRVIVCKDETMSYRVGILVDAITHVTALSAAEISHQTIPSDNADVDVITSISKSGQKVLGILDLQKILLSVSEGKVLHEDDSTALNDSDHAA